MFQTIKTIAVSEFRSLLRQKTFALLLGVFLLMGSFAAYIGLSTKITISKVYNEAAKEMIAGGVKKVPPNPFLTAPPLAILNNMVVYVFIIGALLAIVVGHSALIRERRAGMMKIIFSKPITRFEFVLGKTAGISLALASVMTVSFVVSLVSTMLISSRPLSSVDTLRLFLFYAVSLGYVLIFSMTGLFFAARSKSESLALLVPVVIWILITFVMPQLTSALGPTASLNPASAQGPLPQTRFFTVAREIIHPLAISESYQSIGASLLRGGKGPYPVLPLFTYFVLILGSCVYIMEKFNVCQAGVDE